MITDKPGMTFEERVNRLDELIAADRVMRGRWRADYNGREKVCLLLAMFPEYDHTTDVLSHAYCRVDGLPHWFAIMVPDIDDMTDLSVWPAVIRRFAAAMHIAAKFDSQQWQRVHNEFAAELVKYAAGIESAESMHTAVVLGMLKTWLTDVEWVDKAHEIAAARKYTVPSAVTRLETYLSNICKAVAASLRTHQPQNYLYYIGESVNGLFYVHEVNEAITFRQACKKHWTMATDKLLGIIESMQPEVSDHEQPGPSTT